MIHKEVTTEFGTYVVKYNHGFPVHSNYFCIDAYQPVPEYEFWEKCPCCGLQPKIWRFNNGRNTACGCWESKYDHFSVHAESIMSVHIRCDGNLTEYSSDQLRLNWEEMEYFLFEDGRVSGERYNAREKYWHDKGLWSSGYFPEIEQINLKIMMYKGEQDNLEQTLKTLEQVVPLLKVHQGVKRLGVFEHTCSEHGSYGVEITDTTFDLVVWRWSRKSTVKSFDNLRDLVEYIQKHHYYGDSESDRYDED